MQEEYIKGLLSTPAKQKPRDPIQKTAKSKKGWGPRSSGFATV
jgi:hypothetical protein